jgi:hypothetical protein
LEIDDGKIKIKIGQSVAVWRFLGNRFGLGGDNEFEHAKCDELVESIKDFGNGTCMHLNILKSLYFISFDFLYK